MNRDERRRPPTNLKTELDIKIIERIYNPVVKKLYEAYVGLGIDDELINLIEQLPRLSSPPFFGQWFVNGLLVKSHPKFLWRHL